MYLSETFASIDDTLICIRIHIRVSNDHKKNIINFYYMALSKMPKNRLLKALQSLRENYIK